MEADKGWRALKVGVGIRQRLLVDLKRRALKASTIFSKYDPKIMDHQTFHHSTMEYLAWLHRYMINSLASIEQMEESDGKRDGTKLYHDTTLSFDGGEPIRGIFIPFSPAPVNVFGDIRLGVGISTQTDDTLSKDPGPNPVEGSGVPAQSGASGEKLREPTAPISAVDCRPAAFEDEEEEVLGNIGSFPLSSSQSVDTATLPAYGDAGSKSSLTVHPPTSSNASTVDWESLHNFYDRTTREVRGPPSDASWNHESSSRCIPRPKTAMPSSKLDPDAFEVSISRSTESIRSSIHDLQEFVASLPGMCVVPSRVQSSASIGSLSGESCRYFDAQGDEKKEPGDEAARRSSSDTDVVVTYRNPKGPKQSACDIPLDQWLVLENGKEGREEGLPKPSDSINLLAEEVNKVRKELMTPNSKRFPKREPFPPLDAEMVRTLIRWRDEREDLIQEIKKARLRDEVKSAPTLKVASIGQVPPEKKRQSEPKMGTNTSRLGDGSPETIQRNQAWAEEMAKLLQEKEKLKEKQETKVAQPTQPHPEVIAKKLLGEQSPRKAPIVEIPAPKSPPPLLEAENGGRKELISQEKELERQRKLKQGNKSSQPAQPIPSKATKESQLKAPASAAQAGRSFKAKGQGVTFEPKPEVKLDGTSKPAGRSVKGKAQDVSVDPQPPEVKPEGTWRPIGRKVLDELQEVLKTEALMEAQKGAWKLRIPEKPEPKEKEPQAIVKKPEGTWKPNGRRAEELPETKPKRIDFIDLKPEGTWKPNRSPEENSKPRHQLIPIKDPFPQPFGPKPELNYAELGSRRQPEEEPQPRERLIPDKDPFPAPYQRKPNTYGGLHKKLVEAGGAPAEIPKTINAIPVAPNKIMKEAKLSVVSHIVPPKPKVERSKAPRRPLAPKRSSSVPDLKDPELLPLVPRCDDDGAVPKSARNELPGRGPPGHPFHVPAARARRRGVSVDRKRFTTEYQASYKPYDSKR